MTEEIITATSKAKLVLFEWSKLLQALFVVGGAVAAVFVHFLGPGIKPAIRDFLGITEISDRVEQIEKQLPAPDVVEWNESASRQIGECTYEECTYLINAARTAYGDQCGRITDAKPVIRLRTGATIAISYGDFTPVELHRQPTSFVIPLEVPTVVPPGTHEWRSENTYAHCPGVNEPMARATPWFPIVVTGENGADQ